MHEVTFSVQQPKYKIKGLRKEDIKLLLALIDNVLERAGDRDYDRVNEVLEFFNIYYEDDEDLYDEAYVDTEEVLRAWRDGLSDILNED